MPSSPKANQAKPAQDPWLNVDVVFAGGGEMGARMRAMDWSTTPLGSLSQWPQSLKTAVRTILNSRYPMFIWWGIDRINLYNDAYVTFLGAKHPAALGRPAQEAWWEIWSEVGPRSDAVLLRGQATYDEGLLLLMERHGYVEETYFTFSYSPLPDDAGNIGGIFCAVTEDTQRVIGERRLTLLSDLGTSVTGARTPEEVCQRAARTLSRAERDLPFCLLYLGDPQGKNLRLAGQSGFDGPHPAAPQNLDLESESPWPLQDAIGSGEMIVLPTPATVDSCPRGPWPTPPSQVVLVPFSQSGQAGSAGVFVAGLNPHRKFDAEFRGFISLLANQIATGITTATAYETERKRAESLAELDRAKTAFFSNVSHEFRTPLTLLLGPIEEAMRDGVQRSAADTERLEVAHRNGLRLLKLVNSLLDFTRIESGRIRASFEAIDIAELTRDLASGFRSVIERTGLSLHVECSPVKDAVFVDREMWEKIVLNLLSNAFKFTLHGEIKVVQKAVGDHLVLSVSDTGTGIPQHELENVFKRFYRIEGAEGRSFEGTGIGLALVQELVRLHGGHVTVTSEKGVGTTFRVAIPTGRAHLPPEQVREKPVVHAFNARMDLFVEEASRWTTDTSLILDAGARQPVAAQSIATGRTKPTVLVVDDNADMREYIGRLLADHYNLKFAANGAEGLDASSRFLPELILADVMMPVMDGFEMAQRLRAQESTRTIPVLMLSARAGEESRVEGLQSGADDYLTKPFTAAELVARVGTHIRMTTARKRVEAELRTERARLIELFHQAPALFAVLRGPDFVFELTNDAYQLLIGGRNVLGKPLREALPEVESQGILQLLQSVYQSGTPYRGQNFRVELARRPGGELEEVFLDFVYQPAREADGTVSGIIVLGIDVTEQRRAQDALIRGEKLAAVGRMASSIAHEINNPLEAVTNLLYLIETSDSLDAAHKHALMADQELKRVSQIAIQTLQFHRQSSAAALTVISNLLDSLLTLFQRRFKNAGVVVRKQWHNDRAVRCFEGELRQVFSNLISNAIDAMPSGGQLTIRTRNTHRNGRGGVLVTVADSGIGIPPAARERLFDAFFTTKQATGTGLGLWIARGILDKHHATIRIRSSQNPQAHGTVIRIFLPYDAVSLD